jgi:hypothetical protein
VPEEKGSRLGRQLGLGSPGMARRFGTDDEPSADRLERARASIERFGVTVAPAGDLPPSIPPRAVEAGPGPSLYGRITAKEVIASEKARRGRPKVGGERPWEAAGMSRRTWYRRRGAEEEKPTS